MQNRPLFKYVVRMLVIFIILGALSLVLVSLSGCQLWPEPEPRQLAYGVNEWYNKDGKLCVTDFRSDGAYTVCYGYLTCDPGNSGKNNQGGD